MNPTILSEICLQVHNAFSVAYRKRTRGHTEQQTVTLRALSGWQLLAEQNYLQSFPQLQSSFCVFISPGCNTVQNTEGAFNLNYGIFWIIYPTVEVFHQLPKK